MQPKMKLEMLPDFCLTNIFKYLDTYELMALMDTTTNIMNAAVASFSTEHKKKFILLKQYNVVTLLDIVKFFRRVGYDIKTIKLDITAFKLEYWQMEKIIETIGKTELNLEELSLNEFSEIDSLTDTIITLKNIKKLELVTCSVVILAKIMNNLTNLEKLVLNNCYNLRWENVEEHEIENITLHNLETLIFRVNCQVDEVKIM